MPPIEGHILVAAVFIELNDPMSVSAHLAVQRNAFSTAQAAAKICDGAASSSIAERISTVQIAKSAAGTTAFALLPSITGHAWIYQGSLVNGNPVIPSDGGVLPVNKDNELLANTIHAFAGTTLSAIGTAATTTVVGEGGKQQDKVEMTDVGANETTAKQLGVLKKKADAPDEFRLVSAAMRLSCINASDQMQGWFEAIRVRPSWSTEGVRIFTTSAGSVTTFALGPSMESWEEGIIRSANWSNDPSYVTGRLRDLGRHTFYLQPVKPRKFQRWPLQVSSTAFDDFEEQPCGFDTTFDVVLVRVFSEPSSASTLAQAIHCHTVKNWETMYDSNKSMARFHTSTIAAKKAVEYADKQMTRDCKASMIRNASSYGYRY